MERVPEPRSNDERELLLGWLAFHRDALAAKCDGMTDEQLIAMSAGRQISRCSASSGI